MCLFYVLFFVFLVGVFFGGFCGFCVFLWGFFVGGCVFLVLSSCCFRCKVNDVVRIQGSSYHRVHSNIDARY